MNLLGNLIHLRNRGSPPFCSADSARWRGKGPKETTHLIEINSLTILVHSGCYNINRLGGLWATKTNYFSIQFWRLGSPSDQGTAYSVCDDITSWPLDSPSSWLLDKVEGTKELCLYNVYGFYFISYALLHQQGFLVPPWKGVVRGSILALCLISVGKPEFYTLV